MVAMVYRGFCNYALPAFALDPVARQIAGLAGPARQEATNRVAETPKDQRAPRKDPRQKGHSGNSGDERKEGCLRSACFTYADPERR